MIASLMMSANVATLGLLKMKVIWNKGYDVIIFAHDVTNNILSLESNYIAHAVMWTKFGNSSISMGEVIIASILYRFARNTLDSSSIIWDWHQV